MKDDGFTLVELLIALLLGSMVLASVGYLIGNFSDQIRRQGPSNPFDQVADAAPTLSNLLERLRPTTTDHRQFEGNLTYLKGKIAPPLALRGFGPLRLKLSVTHDTEGSALILSLESNDGHPYPPLPTRRLLVHGMASIGFQYDHDDGEEDHLPHTITITFRDKGGVEWRLVIEPLLTQGDCRFDPISMTCRA